jgi:two-component system cell cycle sensor histidine kinase/response regulator CckA
MDPSDPEARMVVLGRMAAGVTHDLGNIFTVLLGYADLLNPLIPREGQCGEFLRQMSRVIERGSMLCRNLHYFSGRGTARADAIGLAEFLAESEGVLRRLLGEEVELSIQVEPGTPPVWSDRLHLAQVLFNLVSNARDAMPGGGPLKIEAGPGRAAGAPEKDGAKQVRISVRDRGCGMSPEVRRRLFEPFFTTKPSGQGLGLWTVREIARQWGGSVAVESTPGEGTDLHVILPSMVAGSEKELPVAGRKDAAAESILVVEDSDSMRRFACDILGSLGYSVASVSDGVQALQRVRESGAGPDLLIADLGLPGLGGVELAACIRELYPETKILFVSNRPPGESSRRGKADEGLILYKPFLPTDLASRVFESLSPR